MIGCILCWIGFHDWGYSESGCTFHLPRKYVRDYQGLNYQCLRCGVKP